MRNSRAPDENSGEACCLVDHSWVSPTNQLTSTNRKHCKSVLNGFPEFVIRTEKFTDLIRKKRCNRPVHSARLTNAVASTFIN